jgi:RHH-type proline utilization regulon transcriptional repressor/proline dehydrogenase/delta 1-pyrroline-5-carboxylate dehydrogenase
MAASGSSIAAASTAVPPARERRVQAVGRGLLAGSREEAPRLLGGDWWQQRLLEWAMGDDRLRARLFHFVDVLPSLRTRSEVAAHLAEYLFDEPEHLPAALRAALKFESVESVAARIAAVGARRQVRQMARRFIAGETIAEALATVEHLRRQRMAFTLDVLGEAVTSEVQADDYTRQYICLIEQLTQAASGWPVVPQIDRGEHGLLPRVNVSVKLSALSARFDAIAPADALAIVGPRLRAILRAAQAHGAFVHVDMEAYEHKDLVLDIFTTVLMEDEFRANVDVGIVLQAYLKEAEADFERLRQWVHERGHAVVVRLVKGAYWDTETILAAQRGWRCPVFAHKWETDASFERLTARLIAEHELLQPAIASHNVRSLAHAIVLAEERGLAPEVLEAQMLFGMGDALKAAVVERGLRLRVYAPYGRLIPGMAYLIRRLLENTSNESFLRQSFTERLPVAELLAPPAAGAGEPRALRVLPAAKSEASAEFRNEPLTDFRDPAAREAMSAALHGVRAGAGAAHALLIDGRAESSAGTIDSTDPSQTSFLVGRVACATAELADAAVAAAQRALAAWSRTPVEERCGLLRRAADLLRVRRFELAAWIAVEAGKPWREADGDVAEAIDYCNYYAAQMTRLHQQPHRCDVPGERNKMIYEPRGVAAVIAPWNFPLAILTGMTTAALVTGNTAVVKPSEQTPVIAAKLFEVLLEAGLPAGVANFLPGRGEDVGARLVAHPQVDVIAFTGSREVGLKIIETAARVTPEQRGIKRVIAELGGKNAIIVDADADLDDAVRGVIASAFGYAGQKCSACSRVIVLDAVHDIFVRRLIDSAASLRVGAADDPATDVGPLISAAARDKVLRYIEIGKREARLVGQVDHPDTAGHFVGPVIFDRVLPQSVIGQEEIFGPVLAVMTADSFEQALAIANGTGYALTGGVYTRRPSHIERARREFRVGNLYVDRPITGAMVERQPFGGRRLSGVGSKAGGPDYLQQFCEAKTISENTMRRGFAPEVGLEG